MIPYMKTGPYYQLCDAMVRISQDRPAQRAGTRSLLNRKIALTIPAPGHVDAHRDA